MGRCIISSASILVERFMANAVKFVTLSELFMYLNNNLSYCEDHKDEIDMSLFKSVDLNLLYDLCEKSLVNLCAFKLTDSEREHLSTLVHNLSEKQLVMVYYRNNLYEFTSLPRMRQLFHEVIDPLDKLEICEYDAISDINAKEAAKKINDLYLLYVYYDFPTFDKVRKTMYTDKHNSLYTDTDSVFVSLYKITKFLQNDIIGPKPNVSQRDYDVICVNLMLIYLNSVMEKALMRLCLEMNVDPETSKALNMKNEFIFSRILFTDKKKRYISLAIYQEGQLLGGGLGMPEIKGFDFKKSTTKDNVRAIYEDICINDILRTDNIDLVKIYKKMIALRNDIESSMTRLESRYFKQANVQVESHYKIPYSNQGYVSVQVWNAVCPDYAIELPTDVDIVPIIDLTYKKPTPPKDATVKKNALPKSPKETNKNIAMIAEKFPDLYDRLLKNVYNNPRAEIRHMRIACMAKPKNSEVPLPDWFAAIVDTDKVVNDTIRLFLPITASLGLNTLHTTKSKGYLSTFVSL